jgi:hypothetical protein
MQFTMEDFSDSSPAKQIKNLYDAYLMRDFVHRDHFTSIELMDFIDEMLQMHQNQSEFAVEVINISIEILMCICVFSEQEEETEFLIEKCVPIITRLNEASFSSIRRKDKVLKILSGL